MQTMLLIYNPTSGKGRSVSALPAVVDTLTKRGWLVTLYPTQGKHDATRAAREFGAQFDRIVCAGGDGTLSETVAGLMALPHPPVLGFLPAGSTNDCGITLNLPHISRRAAELVAGDGIPRPWDVGKLNEHPFVYVAAFGAFTEVAYDTPQDLKNAFGHLAYIMAGIASLPNITPYHLRVEYDGNVLEDDFFYGMVCNTYSVGGLRNIPTDKVDLEDGLFEVVLVKRPMSLGEIASALQSVIFSQTPAQGSAVLSIHTSKLTITSDTSIPWTLDGEYGGSYQKNVLENFRHALTIIHGPEDK